MKTAERLIPGDVSEYLGLHHILTLSASSFTGMPHAATVVFVSDGEKLYFYTPGDTTLARNMRDNRRVSFAVDDYTVDWNKVRELHGVGGCAPAEPGAEAMVLQLARQKLGYDFQTPTGVLYAITPIEMHFVDYSYDYDLTADPRSHATRERTIHFDGGDESLGRGPISTDLGRSVFEPGDVIFRPGSGSGRFYVVIDGEVEVRAEGHGADQTVMRVVPGQMFGDQAAFRGLTGQLTAHAVSPTVLLAVDRDAIRDMTL